MGSGHGAGAGRRCRSGRAAGARVATAGAARPARPARRPRPDRAGRHRAGVHAVPRVVPAGLGRGLPRADPRDQAQRRLLDRRGGGDRPAGPPDPHRDARDRHAGGVGAGGVPPRAVRDRLPVRRRAADLRQPRRLQDRRAFARGAGGRLAHIHGQVRRGRGQLVPRAPVCRRPSPPPTAICRRSWSTSSPGSSRT